jgi:homocysteine S-methyltransferase
MFERAVNPFAPFLEQNNVVILDGGLATELERRGADLHDPLWSAKLLLENPNLIRQVHYDYFAAGADVATTASYQATIPGLLQRGLSTNQAADLLRLSVSLARQACDQFWQTRPHGRIKSLVAASIGCYGAFLHDGSEYRGDYGLTVQQLMDWHRPRLQILAAAQPDLIACETVPSLTEGEALVRLLSEIPHMPAWLSFSCRDDRHLCHGERFVDAVQLVHDAPNVVAVGVNCTPPQFIEGLLESAAGATARYLVVYPNSGETWDAATQSWGGVTANHSWNAYVQRWHAAGARLIGGCCRTTPETIRTIAQALKAVESPESRV